LLPPHNIAQGFGLTAAAIGGTVDRFTDQLAVGTGCPARHSGIHRSRASASRRPIESLVRRICSSRRSRSTKLAADID
jgi:hypothetical protein